MVSLATNVEIKTSKPKFNDEFDSYLKRQCLKTTFNGLEIETFSWYKKVLGLIQSQVPKYKYFKRKISDKRWSFLVRQTLDKFNFAH